MSDHTLSAKAGHPGSQSNKDAGDHHGPHIASMGLLLSVFATLVVLTVITVAVAYVDLGDMNLPVAMLIATIKATLVALYFMHLRYDNGFNRLAFFGAFLFVLLFISFTMLDSGQYQDQIDWRELVLKEPAAAPDQH